MPVPAIETAASESAAGEGAPPDLGIIGFGTVIACFGVLVPLSIFYYAKLVDETRFSFFILSINH